MLTFADDGRVVHQRGVVDNLRDCARPAPSRRRDPPTDGRGRQRPGPSITPPMAWNHSVASVSTTCSSSKSSSSTSHT